jgi:hypothetical protein
MIRPNANLFSFWDSCEVRNGLIKMSHKIRHVIEHICSCILRYIFYSCSVNYYHIKRKLKIFRLINFTYMYSTQLILHFPANSLKNVFTHNLITIKETRRLIIRFIYANKITLIERINLAKFRFLLHRVFCWIALNGTSSIVVPVTSTYPSTQWAAVSTQSGLKIEPPHLWISKYSNDAWKHY